MELQIETLSIDKITPYEGNAKLHPDEQIAQIILSIKEFGFNDPIAVWGEDNIIIEGHGRLIAAKRLGMEEVPVIRLDGLTDEQRRAYTLVHNKLTMNSDFDLGILSSELAEIADIDMEDFGFDLSFDDDDEEPEEDEVPEEPEEAVSQLGDIYQLGRHRLICGDSTDPEVIKALLNGQKADLYLTDPPYNVDYTGKTADALKIENDQMEDSKFREFLVDAFSAAKQNLKGGAAIYIWHADSEGYNFRGACHDIGWVVRECLIWKKNVMVLGRQDYQWRHEPCLYLWNDGGSHAWYSDRKQTTILEFDKPSRNKEHPTMKPVALFDYLIKNSSKKGDIVLDSFGGSGTTVIACEQNGRSGYCCELDPKYVDVIVQRWENLTGQKAVLLNRDPDEEEPAEDVEE